MVDVSEKIMSTGHTLRSATARGKVWLNSESAYRLVKDNVHNKKVIQIFAPTSIRLALSTRPARSI